MKTPFKLRSQGSSFKLMGSTPMKHHEKDSDGDTILHADMTEVNDSTTVGNPWLDGYNKDLVKLGVISQKGLNAMGRKFENKKERNYNNRERRHYLKKQSEMPD